MNKLRVFLFFWCLSISLLAQQGEMPCSHDAIIERMSQFNPFVEEELEQNNSFISNFQKSHEEILRARGSEFVIPVVMHVFHDGEEGKMGMDQALSGLQILNDDFNGLNDGWETIAPEFDTIKASLDITFCLAKLDPLGNPTTGINYYDDPQAMLNQGNLFQHAWDNKKYLNIYFPKYTGGAPSEFTAYAYYPNTFNTNNNRDGIFYSSIRWGYGEHSELDDGQDWASVCSHEAGHWLDLRHTFEFGCVPNNFGDLVEDTPLTLGSGIELEGCDNNDFSCDVRTNGENFMDYNHDCKKMFTRGQVDRMLAALFLPSRENLWSFDNLVETGCEQLFTNIEDIKNDFQVSLFPNPASESVSFRTNTEIEKLEIRNIYGSRIESILVGDSDYDYPLNNLISGVYYYTVYENRSTKSGKFIVQ